MRVSRAFATVGVVAILLALLAAVPGIRRSVRETAEYHWLVLTGGLVDVGGYRLRIDCVGSGSPTVVMDAGLNLTRSMWDGVRPELARVARVCAYDRAGLGRSEPGPRPRTTQQIVDELHALLANARIPGPYVLVGHSFGGLNVRLYANRHPEQVAGLVLVDASHEDQYARFAALKPPGEREAYLQHEGGGNDEGADLLRSAEQVRTARVLPPVPVVVISADPNRLSGENGVSAEMRRAIGELQADLARLVPNARHIMAEGSGHMVPLDRPDVVVEAIRTVLRASAARHVAEGVDWKRCLYPHSVSVPYGSSCS